MVYSILEEEHHKTNTRVCVCVCVLVFFFLTDSMIVFDNHLLAATPEVEISVISWNTTLMKDGRSFVSANTSDKDH